MQETLEKFTAIEQIQETFTVSLDTIKDELDLHLDSINQNSVEIQANYDFLEGINAKVDKLESRLDELTSLLKANLEKPQINITSEVMPLSNSEKEIFMTLYTSNEPLTYEEIASRTKKPEYVVEDLITSIKIKQIPVTKKTFAGKVLVMLDDEFKDMQAKHNIVPINGSILTSY